jgi:superfamily II DNA or RNA helicase
MASPFQQQYPSLKVLTKDGGRPAIPRAAEFTVSRYLAIPDSEPMGHLIPPRVGKASLIVSITAELRAAGCPAVFTIVPWEFLAKQLVDKEKIKSSLGYYGIDFKPTVQRIQAIKHHRFYQREQGTPDLMSMTMGLAHHNRDNFLEALALLVEENPSKPPVVIIDEAHVVCDTNKAWGATMREFSKAGAFVVGLTGTSERQDMEPIPGFHIVSKEDLGSKDIWSLLKIKGVRDGVRIAEFEKLSGNGSKCVALPRFGHSESWKSAFDQGWLNKINFIPVDFDIEVNGEKTRLSELTKNQLEGNLGFWLKQDRWVASLTDIMLERLNLWREIAHTRKSGPIKPQALIVTSPDTREGNKGSNYHARQVRRAIEDQLSLNGKAYLKDITIEIATSTNTDGTPDETASDKIKRFVAGEIDILIVKYMALVGMDAPGCKIELNLSSLRSGPMAVQMITRICTVWDQAGMKGAPGDFIYPADVLHEELNERIRDSQGKDVWKMERTGEIEERELKETPDENFHLGDAFIQGYENHTGDKYEGGRELLLRAIKLKYRHAKNLTDVEILETHDDGGYPIKPAEIKAEAEAAAITKAHERVRSLDEELDELRGNFGKKAQKLANKIAPYRQDPDKFKKLIIFMQGTAKQKCGVYEAVNTIEDPDLLMRLINALDAVYGDIVFRGVKNAQ